MKIVNIIGLCLNILGSIMIAFSFGKHPEEAYTENEKGEKTYMASFLYPKLFYWGIIFLGMGFLMQLLAVIFER